MFGPADNSGDNFYSAPLTALLQMNKKQIHKQVILKELRHFMPSHIASKEEISARNTKLHVHCLPYLWVYTKSLKMRLYYIYKCVVKVSK